MLQLRSDLMVRLRSLADKVARVRVPQSVALVLPRAEEDKLGWLNAGGRDFEKVTPEMVTRARTAFEREVKRLVSGASTNRSAPWIAAGVEVARQISIRIAAGDGGDVSMPALKRATIEKKRRDGVAKPSAIGYHTGDLYRRVRDIVDGKKVKVTW